MHKDESRQAGAKIYSVKHNFVMNLVLTASSFVFPLITYPYISRVLQVVANGKVSFATSILTYFAMFASLGIPTYGIRVCAQVRDDKEELSRTVHELLVINLVSTVVTYLAFFLSLALIPNFKENRELLLVNSLSLILNTIGVSWFYSALEQYNYITIRSLIFKSISVILTFLLVRNERDYVAYAAILVLSTGGSNILNFIHLRNFIIFKPVGHYNFKRHLRPIFIFFGSAVASSIYVNLDTVMLGFIAGSEQVGYYQVATKIKLLLTSFVTSLGAVLMPRLSYYVEKGRKAEFDMVIVKSFNFVLIVASSLVCYFIIFAREAILVLAGSSYMSSVLPMQIVLPSVLFIGLSYITGLQILTPLMKEKKMLISYIVASIVSFSCNLVLIPFIKASGAAISTTLAEFTVLILQCAFLWPILKPLMKTISIWKTFLALTISNLAIIILKKIMTIYLQQHPFIILLISSIIYFGLYLSVLYLLQEPFIRDTVLVSANNVKHSLRRHHK
ncbi:flippase [Oscillospiraceae bacterium HV4-5-C5C]|nr:flippase [Oscillospiraceae bacterium HV4-5-C5C]